MACEHLNAIARDCGKNTKAGMYSDLYLIAFNDLKAVSGSTEVYNTAVSGLISEIGFVTASTKFVKYGTANNVTGYKESQTTEDNGAYNVNKEITFTLSNLGSVAAKKAAENLIANPVVALMKMKNSSWVIAGLNGQFMLKSMEGSVDNSTNGRVIVLAGDDIELTQIVDPTIITGLLAA